MANENDMMDAEAYELEHQNDDIHLAEVAHEEYLMEQDALPAHKRDGWAKRLYEIADEMRDQQRYGGMK
jgi:hypothetical protein